MPFTPFHFGLGALAKAVGKDKFSFLIFAGSQVLMDVEPGVRMLSHAEVIHGPSHTIFGALAIGTVAMVVGKPVSEFAIRVLSQSRTVISWKASWAGAFTGTLSHVVLDSFMHADMHPLRPISDVNSLLGIVSLKWLHWGLIISGLLGLVLVGYNRFSKRAEKPLGQNKDV